nr:hypothetical protein DM860_001975 [Ipomoea trifida]
MSEIESQKPKPAHSFPPPPSTDATQPRVPIQSSNGGGFSGGHSFPNPPDRVNPDPATLREQWKFAIRQYSKWYSHAWGTAILAGASFFALGWIIKGGNPLPSLESGRKNAPSEDPNAAVEVKVKK